MTCLNIKINALKGSFRILDIGPQGYNHSFISNISNNIFYQHRHLHQYLGIIIGLPRVYFGVGKTVFIGRLADPLDLR